MVYLSFSVKISYYWPLSLVVVLCFHWIWLTMVPCKKNKKKKPGGLCVCRRLRLLTGRAWIGAGWIGGGRRSGRPAGQRHLSGAGALPRRPAHRHRRLWFRVGLSDAVRRLRLGAWLCLRCQRSHPGTAIALGPVRIKIRDRIIFNRFRCFFPIAFSHISWRVPIVFFPLDSPFMYVP